MVETLDHLLKFYNLSTLVVLSCQPCHARPRLNLYRDVAAKPSGHRHTSLLVAIFLFNCFWIQRSPTMNTEIIYVTYSKGKYSHWSTQLDYTKESPTRSWYHTQFNPFVRYKRGLTLPPWPDQVGEIKGNQKILEDSYYLSFNALSHRHALKYMSYHVDYNYSMNVTWYLIAC